MPRKKRSEEQIVYAVRQVEEDVPGLHAPRRTRLALPALGIVALGAEVWTGGVGIS